MTDTKLRLSSGLRTEVDYGYSRAVKVGSSIYVAGTTSTRDGQVVGIDDPGAQARQTLENIRWALEQFGSSLEDVVRYRAFVVDMTRWEPIALELGRVFGAIRPAGTLVGTSGLIRPEMLVEIEVDAIIGSGDAVSDLTPSA